MSGAVTTYVAGPMLDPCTTLADIVAVADNSSRNLVQCARPLRKFSTQLNIWSGICRVDILSRSFWCLMLSKALEKSMAKTRT